MAGVYDFDKDLHIEGDAWSFSFRRLGPDSVTGIDLTGLAPKMMIRDPLLTLSDAPLLTVPAAAWEASPYTTGARIPDQSDPANAGRVYVFVASADNTVPPGKWSYDVQLTDAHGNVTTFLRGSIIVTGQVTT